MTDEVERIMGMAVEMRDAAFSRDQEAAEDALRAEIEKLVGERDAAVQLKTFAHLSFEHDWAENEFCDKLCGLISDFTGIGWDYYDCSLEIYEVPDDVRLSEEAQRFLFDAGFGRVFVNHRDGWETNYIFGKEFLASEGHHHKANWKRTHEDANRRVTKDRDALAKEVEGLRAAVGGFLLKYDQIAPILDGMFSLNFARTGIQYSGPTWEAEMKALKDCVHRIQEAKG